VFDKKRLSEVLKSLEVDIEEKWRILYGDDSTESCHDKDSDA